MIELGKMYMGDGNVSISDGTLTLRNTKVIIQDGKGNVIGNSLLGTANDPDPLIPDESTTEVINPSFSTNEMVNHFLFGIDLSDQDGNQFPQSLLVAYLNAAITWSEALLDICLTPTHVVAEPHDYERTDYTNWGYLQLWKRPVQKVTAMRMMYGTRPSFEVPLEWIKVDKNSGKLQMFPSSGSATNLIISSTGVIYGMFNKWNYAPQMWEVDYEAGMVGKDIPAMMKELIYKKAVIGILQVWGDLILGAGIASSSVSIDGLSQSIGTAA